MIIQCAVRRDRYFLVVNRMVKSEKKSVKGEESLDYYGLAKYFQYDERNLPKALEHFKLAVQHRIKTDSAIKDAAAVLHQLGNTKEACQYLKSNRWLIRGDLKKYDNLLRNLQKQLTPSGKFLNKSLLLQMGCVRNRSEVCGLFRNYSRVEQVEFFQTVGLCSPGEIGRFALLSFQSYSSAKKTLQTLVKQTLEDGFRIFWVNVNRLVSAEAYPRDSSAFSCYHGDSTWPWALVLPELDQQYDSQTSADNSESVDSLQNWPLKIFAQLQDQPSCSRKIGRDRCRADLQQLIRDRENAWKMNARRLIDQ